MALRTLTYNYRLNPENVDIISDLVGNYVQSLNMPQKTIIRARLSVETVLLSWMEQIPEETEISVKMGKQFTRPYVQLFFAGSPANPLKNEDDELDYYGNIVANAGLSINYAYYRNCNTVEIKLPMTNIANYQKLLFSFLAAMITTVCVASGGTEFTNLIAGEMVVPIFNSLVNLLSGVAAFMIFFNILHCVINMGDIRNLSSIGTKVLKYISVRNLQAIILSVTVCCCFFNVVTWRTDMNHNVLRPFTNVVSTIIPPNLVQPFIDGNTIQLILMAVLAGILTLILGQQVKWLFNLVENCDTFFSSAIVYFSKLFPVVVYLALTRVMLSSDFVHAGEIFHILCVVAIISTIYVAADTSLAAIRSRMGIWKYITNIIPPGILALSSGNAPACGALWDKACSKLAIDDEFYKKSAPVCQILSASGFMIVFVTVIMGFQDVQGIKISVPELIIAVLTYFLLFPAPSGTPGGSISIMTVLMAQNNLPEYGIAMYIAANVFFDMLITWVNTVGSINNMVGAAYFMKAFKEK